MSLAYLHMLLNHVPVIGMPVAALFLIHAIRTGNAASRKFALLMLAAIAAMALPTYLTGEEAEEIVEHLAGVSHDAIEEHEGAGLWAMISAMIVGATALASFWFGKTAAKAKKLDIATLVLCLWSLAVLARTGYLGGAIRHPEFHPTADAASGTSNAESPPSDD